jgi:hypothetical protein
MFILYTGLVTMINMGVHEDILVYVAYLMSALRILTDKRRVGNEAWLRLAEECIKHFVKHSVVMSGEEFVSYNVHGMLHLVDEVRRNKGRTLEELSAFGAENFFGQIMKYIRAPYLPLVQLVNVVEQLMAWQERVYPGGYRQKAEEQAQLPQFEFSKRVKGHQHRYVQCDLPRERGVFSFNSSKLGDRFCEMNGENGLIPIQLEYFETRAVGDDIVQFACGRRLQIDQTQHLFQLPTAGGSVLKSSKFGIHVDCGPVGEIQSWPIAGMGRKYFRMPLLNNHVLIPVLSS